MKYQLFLFILAIHLILCSCAPKITTNVFKTYPPIDYRQKIIVFENGADRLQKAEVLGSVNIGDNGYLRDCNYEYVLDLAKIESRKAGGNALRVIQHISPTGNGNTCHKISAEILRIENLSLSYSDGSNNRTSNIKTSVGENQNEKLLQKEEENNEFVIMYLYSPKVIGYKNSYNLYLNDSVLCRMKSNDKKKIKIRKYGKYKLWTKTDTLSQITLNLKSGDEYYICCGIQDNENVEKLSISQVEKSVGISEFNKIKVRKDAEDIIYRKNGKKVYCKIISEDQQKVIIVTEISNNKMETFLDKNKITKIEYAQ